MIDFLTTAKMLTILPFALSAILVGAMALRTVLVKIRTGQNPNYLKASDDVMGFCAKMYSVSFIVMVLFLIGRLIDPSLDILVGPILLLASKPMIAFSGIILGLVGVMLCLWAMIVISKNWRIGIPESAENDDEIALVTSGPFSVSRNPFFLGVQLLFLGIFLMAPSAITLAVSLLIFCTVNVQVREEEAYLVKKIGPDYETYFSKVRRWI
ncbi:isoprenylcysteine carboxylmethyltransferase family protein [Temperatibacter marinus]|uniref:Isoprenylcysteine carboxylmethyltransferase family protein n=1 Tax=Temperatibacter marinus TaxID=1456591 RepID=A0AA52EI02_9PROT|nr:isoprenylcysteine carboxylmethyltransferase family protein [Temperatibacter marinus]WND03145.1 isoprenylcysteine carboxylmethyltransferase family protein [Temperatibacter marinus]